MELPNGTMRLTYSGHARTAAARPERFGYAENIDLPRAIDLKDCEVVEAEMAKGNPVPEKIVVRYPYSDNMDLVMPMYMDSLRLYGLMTVTTSTAPSTSVAMHSLTTSNSSNGRRVWRASPFSYEDYKERTIQRCHTLRFAWASAKKPSMPTR